MGCSLAGSNPARSVVSIAIKKSCAALKQMFSSFILYAVFNQAVMAKWLRCLTRNQMGYSLAGSNRARSVVSIAIKKSCAALKQMFSSFILYAVINQAVMAEWLRRLT